MTNRFSTGGKIQDQLFNELIYPYCGATRGDVPEGPQYGVDVSLVRLPGNMAMALTSDPLSLIPTLGLRESAWLSVHLMANDMATTGMPPMFVQLVLNLPSTLEEAAFREYWMHIHHYCKEIGVAVTGGHTGKAEGQNSTMAGGGTMITIGPEDRLLLSKYARPGDVILVTKACALVATSILALSFPQTVRDRCGQEVQQAAAGLFYETSALPAALCAMEAGDGFVTAMHDATEGGVAGAIYEMAMAAGCGAYVFGDRLPVGAAQQSVCAVFDIDPRYCVGAGAMIITVKPDKKEQVLQHLQQNGIAATEVGVMTKKEDGLLMHERGAVKPLQHPGTDPYWNAFFTALKKGWK